MSGEYWSSGEETWLPRARGDGPDHGLDLDLRAADPEGLELLAPIALDLGERLPGLRAPAERRPQARLQVHPDGRRGPPAGLAAREAPGQGLGPRAVGVPRGAGAGGVP